jgi:uncharacterized membrane protein YhaH (DUF805 family)
MAETLKCLVYLILGITQIGGGVAYVVALGYFMFSPNADLTLCPCYREMNFAIMGMVFFVIAIALCIAEIAALERRKKHVQLSGRMARLVMVYLGLGWTSYGMYLVYHPPVPEVLTCQSEIWSNFTVYMQVAFYGFVATVPGETYGTYYWITKGSQVKTGEPTIPTSSSPTSTELNQV